jgi:hypothetical protein
MRQLEPNDHGRIERHFAKALESRCLLRREEIGQRKGGLRKSANRARTGLSRGSKAVRRFIQGGRKAERPIEWGEGDRAAMKVVAEQLTDAWFERSADAVSPTSETWTSALESCLKDAATSESTDGSRDCRAWRYVITRSDAEPTLTEIDDWAAAVSSEVIRRWGNDRHLKNVVAQLNAESGLGLQQALVASSQGITRSLWQIALAIASLSVVGGGGIALLVLFVDKG